MDFYSLSARTPSGQLVPMSDYKGKVVLIVNTATRCGLSPQFEGLEKLHRKYKDEGLVVLGFPCNQFKNQEPETNATVEQTCLVNYGVTFRLFEKSDVNGSHTNPVFAYLKRKKPNLLGGRILWNFTKFLVDRNGKVVRRYSPVAKPEGMESTIEKFLHKR